MAMTYTAPDSRGAINSGMSFATRLTSVETACSDRSGTGKETDELGDRFLVAVVGIKPRVPCRFRQDHRHPVVDRRHHI